MMSSSFAKQDMYSFLDSKTNTTNVFSRYLFTDLTKSPSQKKYKNNVNIT